MMENKIFSYLKSHFAIYAALRKFPQPLA